MQNNILDIRPKYYIVNSKDIQTLRASWEDTLNRFFSKYLNNDNIIPEDAEFISKHLTEKYKQYYPFSIDIIVNEVVRIANLIDIQFSVTIDKEGKIELSLFPIVHCIGLNILNDYIYGGIKDI